MNKRMDNADGIDISTIERKNRNDKTDDRNESEKSEDDGLKGGEGILWDKKSR